jgi:ABC-type bacteriocin/lantibiotic exporter with double-glycine peptidase domain
MLTRIRQSRGDNCGIACVAMIAKVSIDEALTACRRHIYPFDNHTATLFQLNMGLRLLGFKTRISRNSNNLMGKYPSLMPFQWHYGAYHCVVWDPDRADFLDPAYDGCYSSNFYRRKWRELKQPSGKSEGILILGKLEAPSFSLVA